MKEEDPELENKTKKLNIFRFCVSAAARVSGNVLTSAAEQTGKAVI